MEEYQDKEFNSVEEEHKLNTRKILDDISITNETTIEISRKSEVITQKRAYWLLACVVGWLFLTSLSVLFGINSIWSFIGNGTDQSSLLGFIKEVSKEDVNAGKATKYFFQAIAYSFEAGLFIFFIVYSIKMSIKNYIPYSKWYKSTEPLRLEKELRNLKEKQERTKQAAANAGIRYKEKTYDEKEIKKEISLRKKDTRSLDRKIKNFNKK